MWTTGRDEPEVTNQYERVRTPTLESTDQKVGGSSPSDRVDVFAGQASFFKLVAVVRDMGEIGPSACQLPFLSHIQSYVPTVVADARGDG